MSNFPVDDFFADDTLTDAATLTTVAGGSSTINVHFFNEFQAATTVEVPFEGAEPLAYCKTSDVEEAALDDTLTVGSTEYKIKEMQPDGTGITILILYR